MAMINVKNMKKSEKERNTIHNEVDATYSSFTGKDGIKYFQIDSYGSTNRQFQGKISQSIQLNKSSALELIKLLKSEFRIQD